MCPFLLFMYHTVILLYMLMCYFWPGFFFLNPSQDDSRRLGSLSGSPGFVRGCFMVHHDVVRNSCPTSVKTFCQSILHSMDSKYMYLIRHHLLHILQNQVYYFMLWYSIWTLEGIFYFKSKFWSLSQFINFGSFFFNQYMHLFNI